MAPDEEGIARVLDLEHAIRAELAFVTETVPAFNKLLIEGDPFLWDPVEVEQRVRRLIDESFREPARTIPLKVLTLPACYDIALAPDLGEVARHVGVTAKQIAEIHSGAEYTVLATGFAPGFAYLGTTDERLSLPRLPSPRPYVEAGSLAIADRRTGVYPSSGPGGWRLIARVPATLFADVAERIARFEPGMRVRFRSVSRADYEREAGE